MVKKVKDINDKFYTKREVSKRIIESINLSDYDLIVEPAAGDGSFLEQLNHPNVIGVDILPESENIIKCDWLEFTFEQQYNKVLAIGNPPFGRQGSLALKFIKKCDNLGITTIAFILPKSFKKDSFKSKIPLMYHLTQELDVEKGSFLLGGTEYDVPSVFQIWERKEYGREIKQLPKTSKYFSFVNKESEHDFSFRRVGYYAGAIHENTSDKAIVSHYFIKNSGLIEKNILSEIISNLTWTHNNTVGSRSISKPELIEKVETEINKLGLTNI